MPVRPKLAFPRLASTSIAHAFAASAVMAPLIVIVSVATLLRPKPVM